MANLITTLLKTTKLSNMRIQVTWLLSDIKDPITLFVAKFIGTIINYQGDNIK